MTDGNQQPQFPRLAISDLLILTLSVAFTLASIAPNYQEALRRGDVTAWDVTPDLFGYLAIGLSLFGLIVLGRQRVRGSDYALSPGHWVFIATGPFSVLALAALFLRPLLYAYVPSRQPWIRASDNLLFILVISCSIVLSMRAIRVLELRWRFCLFLIYGWLIALALLLARDSANVFDYWPGTPWKKHLIAISTTFEILAAIAGLVAFTIDVIKGAGRDWLHYLGIAALLFHAIEGAFTWGQMAARFWRDLFFYLLP